MNAVQGMFIPHPRVHPELKGESRTHQSFAKECDINNIMKKYEKTGILEHARQHGGEYGDFIAAPDYHTALNEISRAEEMFMAIPAAVRAKFGNDAAAFLAYAQDPKNLEGMRELGLAPPAVEEKSPVAPTPPVQAPPEPPQEPPQA